MFEKLKTHLKFIMFICASVKSGTDDKLKQICTLELNISDNFEDGSHKLPGYGDLIVSEGSFSKLDSKTLTGCHTPFPLVPRACCADVNLYHIFPVMRLTQQGKWDILIAGREIVLIDSHNHSASPVHFSSKFFVTPNSSGSGHDKLSIFVFARDSQADQLSLLDSFATPIDLSVHGKLIFMSKDLEYSSGHLQVIKEFRKFKQPSMLRAVYGFDRLLLWKSDLIIEGGLGKEGLKLKHSNGTIIVHTNGDLLNPETKIALFSETPFKQEDTPVEFIYWLMSVMSDKSSKDCEAFVYWNVRMTSAEKNDKANFVSTLLNKTPA